MVVDEEKNKQEIAARLARVFDSMGFVGRGKAQAIADAFQVSRETARKWLSGEALPKTSRMTDIAKRSQYLSEWIWTGMGPATRDEQQKVLMVASDGSGKSVAVTREPSNALTTRRIPVVGRAKGGDHGYFAEEQYPVGHGSEFVFFTIRDENAFALRVVGDSMSPRYHHDEFIIVKPNSEAIPGDDVYVALADDRKLIKRFAWKRGDSISLQSLNDTYAPITVRAEEIKAIYPIGGMLPAGSSNKVQPDEEYLFG